MRSKGDETRSERLDCCGPTLDPGKKKKTKSKEKKKNNRNYSTRLVYGHKILHKIKEKKKSKTNTEHEDVARKYAERTSK